MKIMVSGTRHLGECSHKPDPITCGPARNHRHDMDAAFREHVHPLAARGERLELWQGYAAGADRMASRYWRVYDLGPVSGFSARWHDLGHRAGHVRNGLLVSMMPDMLIAFPWQDASPGTRDAIAQARDAGIRTFVYPIYHLCSAVLDDLKGNPR